MPAVSGIILSGGRSRRMGQDKAFLEVGGRRLIDHVADALTQVSDDLIIVANEPDRYHDPRWRVVPDAFPDTGSLGGLYTGLVAARHAYAVAVACDMPFLNVSLLRYLISQARSWDAAVPHVSGPSFLHRPDRVERRPTAKDVDLQPLHAVYHRRAAAAIRRQIAAGDLRLIGFFPHIRVHYVSADVIARFDPQGLSFFNANTPEEWQLVVERLHA